jgi:hypothetical protein
MAMADTSKDSAVERARAVLRTHRDRLLSDHAATAVGVGLDESGSPAIIVYLPPGRELPEPRALEGVPMIFRKMSPIKPM